MSVRLIYRRDAGTPAERFHQKYVVDAESGCWLWTRSRFRNGYPSLAVDGRMVRAHRFAYELLVGPIPAGLHLDHLCTTPLCVNPAHLEPVTQAENRRRQSERQTHCKHGHPLCGSNLYVDPRRGERRCRQCARDWRRRKARESDLFGGAA